MVRGRPTLPITSLRHSAESSAKWSDSYNYRRLLADVQIPKGPGSRAAGIAMAYKLIDAAQARWRTVNAPHLVALVHAGTVFHKGKLLGRPIVITPETSDVEPLNAGSEVA
jgi:hypothetical protein